MCNFTKGNWEARTDDHSGVKTAVVYLSDKGGFDLSGAPNCIENAHLIAASPEMYGLLSNIKQCIENGHQLEEMVVRIQDFCDEIDETLAKARGEHV